jgi:hypothetical protein
VCGPTVEQRFLVSVLCPFISSAGGMEYQSPLLCSPFCLGPSEGKGPGLHQETTGHSTMHWAPPDPSFCVEPGLGSGPALSSGRSSTPRGGNLASSRGVLGAEPSKAMPSLVYPAAFLGHLLIFYKSWYVSLWTNGGSFGSGQGTGRTDGLIGSSPFPPNGSKQPFNPPSPIPKFPWFP